MRHKYANTDMKDLDDDFNFYRWDYWPEIYNEMQVWWVLRQNGKLKKIHAAVIMWPTYY